MKRQMLKESIREVSHSRHDSCRNVGDDGHDGVEVK